MLYQSNPPEFWTPNFETGTFLPVIFLYLSRPQEGSFRWFHCQAEKRKEVEAKLAEEEKARQEPTIGDTIYDVLVSLAKQTLLFSHVFPKICFWLRWQFFFEVAINQRYSMNNIAMNHQWWLVEPLSELALMTCLNRYFWCDIVRKRWRKKQWISCFVKRKPLARCGTLGIFWSCYLWKANFTWYLDKIEHST